MADAIFGARAPILNTPSGVSPINPSAGGVAADLTRSRAHPGLIRSALVSPDDQVRLLNAIEQNGYATLGELADAIAGHERPVAAVLALIDAGLAELDPASPFDAHLRVWRTRA
jgi:hypothetical protein